MSLPTADKNKLLQAVKEYDYLRISFADLHGVSRSKTASAKTAEKYINNGCDVYALFYGCGISSEQPTDEICNEVGTGNGVAIPCTDYITDVTWLNSSGESDKPRVGQILCEITWKDGSIQQHGPRCVARKQLDSFKSQWGMELLSTFELEFITLRKDSLTPVFDENDCFATLTLSEFEPIFFEFDKSWKKANIDVEFFHCEFAHGQFEFVINPKYGIKSADMAFLFKESLKEMSLQHNLISTFMSKPFPWSTNGAHFNFSLWDETGNNHFYDESKDNKLSDTALYFLGGVLKHAPALTALCCPTVNCYRRLHQPFCPSQPYWALDERFATFRVKNKSKSATYFENRLVSGAANPYLVLAATLAAGAIGIKHKILPPKAGEKQLPKLPRSLEEAISALEKDDAMRQELGSEFVRWFCGCKRKNEIAKFGSHGMENDTEQELEKERQYYFKLL